MFGPGAVLSAVGSIVSGFGSFQASRARAAALRQAARQARSEASMEAQLAVDEGERAAARAAVMGAASGGGFQGSFAGALEQLERTATFNARSAIYAGNAEAANRNYEAKVSKMDGNFALASSVFQAGSSLAGDYMRGAEQRRQTGIRRRLFTSGYGR
ncbi:MAG: hypothetical protein K2X61_04755 [Caulobacteraceae bacterium]|nr:hypothetical protein [Caulobacteraceae bacterium]